MRGLEAKFKTKYTKLYKISDLTLMIEWPNDHPTLPGIRDSLQKEGLLYPILIIKWKLDKWDSFVNENYDLRKDIIAPIYEEKFHLIIRTGNQRVKIAKKLGYKNIDCHLMLHELERKYIHRKIRSDLENQDLNKLF